MHANEHSAVLHHNGDTHDASAESSAADPAASAMVRHVHRERQFGIGYGNSSGYGSTLHFTDGHADDLFRFR